MAVTIKLKRDTAANWTSNNPTLAAGEMGIETDTNKFKFGDGSTAWTSLSYSVGDTNIPLNGLTDVAAQSPNDGDVIQYDLANSKWVTAAPASGSSYSDADVANYLSNNNVTTNIIFASTFAPKAIDQDLRLATSGSKNAKFDLNNGHLDLMNSQIKNIGTPTDTTDAANKAYVDLQVSAGSYSDTDVNTLLESNLTADRIQRTTNNSYFGVGTASGSAGMAIKNNSGQPFFYGAKYLPRVGSTDLELEANTGGKINVNGFRVHNVATPTDTTDGANKAYVDSVASGGGGSSYSDSDVSTFLNGNIDGHLIPDTNVAYDLGSPEKKFRYLYLDLSTMFLGDTPFSASNVDHSMEVYVDQPAPVSSTAEGKKGDVRVVGGFMYVCVDTNTWVRSAVETNW